MEGETVVVADTAVVQKEEVEIKKQDEAVIKVQEESTNEAKEEVVGPKTEKEAPEKETEAPKTETEAPKAEVEAPKAEAEEPKVEAEAPKVEAEAPKTEVEVPKTETDAPKTEPPVSKMEVDEPKTESEAPKTEAEAPKTEAEAPKTEAEVPKTEAGVSEMEVDAPKTEAHVSKPEKRSATQKDRTDSSKGIAPIKKEFLLPKEESPESAPPCKKQRGQNKAKDRSGPTQIKRENELCPQVNRGHECTYNGCIHQHEIKKYMETRIEEIDRVCPNFETYGKCVYRFKCRFAKSHTNMETLEQIIDEEKCKNFTISEYEQNPDIKNTLKMELTKILRKRNYNFSKADKTIKQVKQECDRERQAAKKTIIKFDDDGNEKADVNQPLRQEEKKKIDFSGKSYLAPLTTVGNIPFRRICKEYGVDITCGEMSYCFSLLQGKKTDWTLMRRHSSEDVFGVQIAGSYGDRMTRVAQLVEENCDVDFIDVNCGCPIDDLYKQGIGSGLVTRKNHFQQVVKGMSRVLDCPLTVKIRIGNSANKIDAHTLVPQIFKWGASSVAIHGRTREQRYSREADWNYIKTCVYSDGAEQPRPILGNGDILSWEDVEKHKADKIGVTGYMVGRGALIKPWIFTEIKEQRHWDISSTERFEIVKKYANYGLQCWGSDFNGVERTRRFMLEWLSFLYRYVPVGLLERLPPKMNDRPPPFFGRNDLETLMASDKCSDWIKISEMVLGKVPEEFKFEPKHKARAY